jgi:membrane protein
MEPLDSLHRLLEQLTDRARARSFFRFLVRRFLDDNLLQAAGALSFTTVFAIVPLSIVVFGVLSAFPVFETWSKQLTDYVFANFVPSAASSVQDNLKVFSENAKGLTAAGVAALVLSLLVTLTSVEGAFNQIWRVKSPRPKLGRFLVYWTVFTLGSLLAAATLALSARFFAMAVFQTSAGLALETLMVRLAPMAIEWATFATIYKVVPHRTVQWKHAIAGGLLATVAFEAVKWGLGLYLSTFGSYSKIYGALAAIPVFLLWVYLSWVAVLLGASLASAISAFRYQPAAMRLPVGYEMYALIRLLARFNEARRDGRGLHIDQILRIEPLLTDGLAQQLLAQLCEINVVRRAEDGEWLLSRDLDELTMAELYEACQLRIPIAEAHLPCRDDALGHAAVAAIDELRIPLRDLLKRRVSSIHADDQPE